MTTTRLGDRIAGLEAAIAQVVGDRDAHAGRAQELARRVTELEHERDAAVQWRDDARAERDRLTLLINTPRTDDFFEAVRVEAAHQVERWGVEHDAGKRPEDWLTLFLYLLGKAARAHFDGNRPKLEHHVITSAAVALNWWRHLTGVSTAMRPGVAPEHADAASQPSNIELVDQLLEARGLNR